MDQESFDRRARIGRDRVLRMADTWVLGIRSVRIVSESRDEAERMATAVSEALSPLGYLVVRGAQPVECAVPSTECDVPGECDGCGAECGVARHTAVLLCDEEDAAKGPRWIRQLASDRLRSHLLIDVRPRLRRSWQRPRSSEASWLVRERQPAYGSDDVDPLPQAIDPRLERALAFLKRRRRLSGERWLRAAIESGRRRGDEGVQLAALRVLVRELTALDRWEETRDAALDVLSAAERWDVRCEVASMAVGALTVTGALTAAESLLAGIAAEAHTRNERLPAALSVRRAEVCFWQGRFDEAAELIDLVALGEPETAPVRALVDWARGDSAAIAKVVAWLDDPSAGKRPSPFDARLARACRAEIHLAAGAGRAAMDALGGPRRAAGPRRLDDALLDWLRARASGDRRAAADSEAFIRESGAQGITRWGMGRNGMHLLHAMPALLAVVHDGEDEVAILASACRWLRDQARADAAGFVSPQGDRWVTCDGFDQADLLSDQVREVVQAPGRTVGHGFHTTTSAAVRWGGVTIGLAVARGQAIAATSLIEAVTTVAAISAPALRARLDAIAVTHAGQALSPDILGQSPLMSEVREKIARAALTAFPVLIEGESGTGKELVARALHRLSARRDRRFCAVNCAALTDELVEAELFGHTRGAFTGAVGQRVGLFEEAHSGTLLLDEVSELSPRAQAKVLRVLQEREIRRVGENTCRPVDVRLVAATNRPLADVVAQGTFREDLLFRLAVVRVRLPPLRERVEDIALLAQAFVRRLGPEAGKRAVLGPDALAALARHTWPGNVRELQNAVAGLLVLAPARGRITARHVAQVLPAGEDAGAAATSLVTARLAFERRLVTASLARHAGQRSAAARELGLSRQGLAKAIKRLGLPEVDATGVA